MQAYYTDSIDFGQKRDAELYLNHFLLINMDELDQISESQQAFLKHILQKPVVNARRPNASAGIDNSIGMPPLLQRAIIVICQQTRQAVVASSVFS